MDEKEKELFRKVVLQRDRLHRALSSVYECLHDGILNGLLRDRNKDCPNQDPEAKCSLGHTRKEVLWRMGSFCTKCGYCKAGGHLSYHEHKLLMEIQEIEKVLNDPHAEMPYVSPKDFPEYKPGQFEYAVTKRWIARQFYRFAVGYWCFANHRDQQEEREWERAFNDMLGIALSYLNLNGEAFRIFIDAGKNVKTAEEAKKFMNDHPEVRELIEIASERLEDRAKPQDDLEVMVMHALMLGIEYRFGHNYPGGDVDVYDGVFCGIIDDCLKIAGLCTDDRPDKSEFDDDGEYEQALLEHEATLKERIYAFMNENDGFFVKESGKETSHEN